MNIVFPTEDEALEYIEENDIDTTPQYRGYGYVVYSKEV